MTNLIIYVISFALMTFTIFLAIVDLRKPRHKLIKPFVTFIVPCYNCEKTIEKCIHHIFNSYRGKMELIAINDKSKDNTLSILKRIAKTYPITILNNKKNMGKTKSFNSIWRKTQGSLIWIIDSDVYVDKKAVNECLRRLYDREVGAVSCRYKVIKNNFLSWMVGLEFSMIAIAQSAYNISTSLAIWGGCSVYKREALEEINGLKENMIVEDVDSALRLGEHGWRCEQCVNPVLTYSPETFLGWWKQKIRWGAGGMQCFMAHPKTYLKSPLTIIFTSIYVMAVFSNVFEMPSMPFLNISYLTSLLLLVLISSPYLLIDAHKYTDIFNFFYLIIFVLIYFPIYFIVNLMGFSKGFVQYFRLREGERSW